MFFDSNIIEYHVIRTRELFLEFFRQLNKSRFLWDNVKMRSLIRQGLRLIILLCMMLSTLAFAPSSGQYQTSTTDQSTFTPTDPGITGTPEPTALPSPSVFPTDLPTETPATTQLPTESTPTNTPKEEIPTLMEPTRQPDKMVQVLVGYDPSTAIPTPRQQLRNSLNGQLQIELAKIGVQLLEIPQSQLSDYEGTDSIKYIEPNYDVTAFDTIPNDSFYSAQWGLPLIHAPKGWDTTTGSPTITIAIVDTGVDLSHPEFSGRILSGYDFVNNDDDPMDDEGHGTHVAGIASAFGNNGTGVAGVSWNSNILPVKVLDSDANGTYAGVAAGIIFAADNGAQIINLSLGGYNTSPTLQNAVNYAIDRGVLVVAAAGNDYLTKIAYPAAYPAVVAVAAVSQNQTVAGFSNSGAQMDLAAPGVNVYSTVIGNYGYESGTSMAAPFVSGLAALLFSLPGVNSSYIVENAMEGSAKDISSHGWDRASGHGLIQVDAAIKYLLDPPTDDHTKKTRTPTPGYVNPIIFGLPTSTQATSIPTFTLTPNLDLTESEISGMSLSSTPTSIAGSINPSPAPSNDLNNSAPKTILPLVGGICLVGGGGALWFALWLWKRNKSHSE